MTKDVSERYPAGTKVAIRVRDGYNNKIVTATLGESSRIGMGDWTYSFRYEEDEYAISIMDRRLIHGFGLQNRHILFVVPAKENKEEVSE